MHIALSDILTRSIDDDVCYSASELSAAIRFGRVAGVVKSASCITAAACIILRSGGS